ncbi:MAG: hypothetical protein WC817_03360 [Patescibacteria group bacterium]|jgi:cytidine deaminase
MGIISMQEYLQGNPEVLNPCRETSDEQHFRRWEVSREALVQKAYDASKLAISYRDFRVGCAVLAWRPRRQSAEPWQIDEDPADYLCNRWATFTGANLKPEKSGPKICAEQIAVNSARMAHYTRIIGIVVVGEPQSDDDSGLTHDTLHPCVICRRLLAALPEMRSDTRILTGGLHGDRIRIREYSFEELLKLHQTQR